MKSVCVTYVALKSDKPVFDAFDDTRIPPRIGELADHLQKQNAANGFQLIGGIERTDEIIYRPFRIATGIAQLSIL